MDNGRKLQCLIQEKEYRVISSPLGRCKETAGLIVPELGFDSDRVEFDDRLKELCYGDWQGRTKQEIQTRDADLYQRRSADRWNTSAPNGESYRDVAVRLASWLTAVQDETVVAVSHGCAGRILRGLHGNLDRKEISNLEESHDSIYLLTQGGVIEEITHGYNQAINSPLRG